MKSYITKPKSIKIRTNYSLSARDYRVLSSKNKNVKILKDIIISEFQWKEIWSDGYLGQSKYRFLKTGNIWKSSFLLDTGNIEYCFPVNQKHPKDGDILIAKDGGWDGLWDVILYKKSLEYIDTISAGIHCITPEHKNRYYIFWLLKTQFFKNFVDLNTAWWSIIRHAKKIALDFPLPFPTIKNHPHPEQVEEYISLLVQNMIDKEEQIKAKNEEIDRLIENELRENQKGNIFRYAYPRIWEIREETRFDTWIYEKEFKRISNLIDNYTDGKFYLDENKIAPGVTPKDYYFSDSKKNHNFYDWVTPKNIDQRQLAFHTYIFTKTKSKIKNNSLILNGIRYVGNGIFVEKGSCIYANQNTLIINQFDDKLKQLFLFCFLTSNLGKKLQLLRRNFWIVPILYTEHLCKISIPDFPDSKQQEIAKLYYNPIPNNADLTLETYLKWEKIRNSEVGIFQLNMEIFELREILEETIDRIVMEETIEIIL